MISKILTSLKSCDALKCFRKVERKKSVESYILLLSELYIVIAVIVIRIQ